MDKKNIRNVVINTRIERGKVSLWKDDVRKRFEEKVNEIVDVPNLWRHFKDGVLRVCDESCGKKRGRGSKGDTWWWNEEMKKLITRNTDSHKAMCRNSAETYMNRYKNMKNKAKKSAFKSNERKGFRGTYFDQKLSKWNI